ncbi:hypothetical protein H2200_003076 [Cladophialophora chaetospira]|uniref:ERCC4 domain-containing protein n=1 Tax=Cladophialophora chaetospira TaxID=386627 RepID=A0AA38XGN6_9EURO|nr:hypothetical protein H2200_003076 [Cladophialophora chaetospira]
MAEVVELLSSSSPPRPPSSNDFAVSAATKATVPRTFDFVLDDFDETGSLDFDIDRPTKKARLSPKSRSTSRITELGPITKNAIVDFDLSSDDDLLGDLKRKNTPVYFKSTSNQSGRVDSLDEIVYSSSAPQPLLPEKRDPKTVNKAQKFDLDSLWDNDVDEPPVSQSQPEYDHRTNNILASLTQGPDKHQKDKSKVKNVRGAADGKPAVRHVDDIEFSSPVKAKPSRSTKLSEAEKAVRAAERTAQRAAAKADKEAAKEAEKAHKALEKEQKEKAKQKAADLAEVNKSRTNKKDATPEMILEMSSFLKDTSVGNQVQKRMDNVRVEVNYIDEEINLTDDGAEQEQYGSIITWRRKVKSKYNDEEDQWEPTSGCRVIKEKHILIHLPAGDFAAIAAVSRSGSGTSISHSVEEMKANLDAHVFSIRRRFGDCIPVYLLESLRTWLKKNLNAKNRAYTAGVRAQLLQADAEAQASSQARGRKRKKPGSESLDLSHVTSDIVDDLLLHLQLAHQPILIHHTPTPTDSASQISALTQHLATRPYRAAQLEYNLKSASFCMDSGQVKTGDDVKDTFVKMLQEVQRVTPSMAYGIVEKYKSIRKLVKGFDKHGNLLLEDVHKTVNKDGGWSDKRLGPQVSKRLFKVFMGRDPAATDGMS